MLDMTMQLMITSQGLISRVFRQFKKWTIRINIFPVTPDKNKKLWITTAKIGFKSDILNQEKTRPHSSQAWWVMIMVPDSYRLDSLSWLIYVINEFLNLIYYCIGCKMITGFISKENSSFILNVFIIQLSFTNEELSAVIIHLWSAMDKVCFPCRCILFSLS